MYMSIDFEIVHNIWFYPSATSVRSLNSLYFLNPLRQYVFAQTTDLGRDL